MVQKKRKKKRMRNLSTMISKCIKFNRDKEFKNWKMKLKLN